MTQNEDYIVELLNDFFKDDEISGSVKKVLEGAIRLEIKKLHVEKARINTDIYNLLDAEATYLFINEQKNKESVKDAD